MANNDNRRCNCSGGCQNSVGRRDFLKIVGFGAAAWQASLPVMAGPFEASDFEKMIPADKKLDPAWLESLVARGTPAVYRGAELATIGMPVGGLCSGQLYLGGDGKLWCWDIFNRYISTGEDHYAHPPKAESPLQQGFGIRVRTGETTEFRSLDHEGFQDITFRGEYPIGFVKYSDDKLPVSVSLEAFSPFVPLDTDASSLPATVMKFTVKNTSNKKVDLELLGWLENGAGIHTAKAGDGSRCNRILREPKTNLLECSATAAKQSESPSARPDIVFDNFDKETYEGWTVTGTAFGKGPIPKSKIPAYQGDVGSPAKQVVNSHASAPQGDANGRDSHTGMLTSKPFKVERNFINFWIGGGDHPGKTCIDLLVDGAVVRSATGHNSNAMRREMIDVRQLQGKTAQLRIVDNESGGWGNIGIAEISFSDKPAVSQVPFQDRFDFGTMTLGLLEPQDDDLTAAAVSLEQLRKSGVSNVPTVTRATPERILGALSRKLSLEPGMTGAATFVLTWHFPNLQLSPPANANMKDTGRFYAAQYASATEVAKHVAEGFEELYRGTRLWHNTWYDSSLPYWFLDRTFANTSILASSTCHRFKTGRFYAWEGVGCCEGTCTHVWHYAHAAGRLFPELERDLRVRTDFGAALDPKTGVIEHRGESCGLAVDGQAGCILRAYREHQMSRDDKMLRSLWPKIKLAMNCLVKMDNGAGILEGPQHNTLDQPWFGKVAWLSSLYVAAARACEEMAKELGDEVYAKQMHEIALRGGKSIDRELFNGEYYYQIADKEHAKSVGSHDGCEIDQVFGQSWAYQVGLGRILDKRNVKKALQSLWRYNFTPDVGPFRNKNKPGRWYAMAGEGGLIMCTWPRGDAKRLQTGFDFYFNECMTGFEYQVAWHMIWEGMLQEGLAIVRAIHDRYHPSRRNPWNEVECGDHYGRAMASYGAYLAMCGYRHHGPQGFLAFAPRLKPEYFRAAFTAAGGWGQFQQRRDDKKQTERIEVRWGKVRIASLEFETAKNAEVKQAVVQVDGKQVDAKLSVEGTCVRITLAVPVDLEAGSAIDIVLLPA